MNGQDRRSGRRRAYDIFFKTVVYLSAFLTVALLVVLIGYIFVRGLPHITGQLLSTAPSVLKDTIGILPNILNTLYIILFTQNAFHCFKNIPHWLPYIFAAMSRH